ncbi:MAG: hypothetical protein AB7S75_16710 [Desulfococcaceae bacterium]
MTRIVSGLVFYALYNGIYFIPILFIILIVNLLGINISELLDSFEPIRKIIAILFLAYAIIPFYRAKLAADAYGERNMLFWEAHSVSGTILRSHLSFLPVIGRLFEIKKQNIK